MADTQPHYRNPPGGGVSDEPNYATTPRPTLSVTAPYFCRKSNIYEFLAALSFSHPWDFSRSSAAAIPLNEVVCVE